MALAFTYWREEFEDVKLSEQIRKAPIENKIFNFKSYKERFSLYLKGNSCFYLEDLLDSYFKVSRNFDLVDLNQLKKIVATLLSYFLLDRFYQYLDLTLQPSKYKSNNYYLSTEIPIHLIVMDEQANKMTIYHQNIFEKLRRLFQDIPTTINICGFDRHQKYESYRTALQQAISKMDLKNYEKS